MFGLTKDWYATKINLTCITNIPREKKLNITVNVPSCKNLYKKTDEDPHLCCTANT